ncbi:hypothetical protein CERSUDRAFT_156544 [Gelatoporia subvermispora B]|uniref:[histone H3]-trimethyl-L-lysine(9) demethylase n=1 Tax=Ceriporiopsis subvermispora (strain B) TaxID=914234 RepID=M2QFI3_CERS8|nr:hypothetical protein CERSUDRAFT_156544 [Gelatoporia subvermispora B]
MSTSASSPPSLTPSRSPSPELPLQPDHFYGSENQQLPPSPRSDGKTWLDPADDPLAQRGIPVFKPTMEEFQDFEAYMSRVECWGMRSGIVKVIPPKEWTDKLPSPLDQLGGVKLKSPIEQHMLGRGGLFRQENVEKRRIMSMREWAELCAQEDLRAPGVDDIGLHARATNGTAKARTRRTRRKRESETAEPDQAGEGVQVKEEEEEPSASHDHDRGSRSLASPPSSIAAPTPAPAPDSEAEIEGELVDGEHKPGASEAVAVADSSAETRPEEEVSEEKPKTKGRRTQTRQAREANLAERAAKDKVFLENFDPHSDWLPPNTTPFDYTPEFCRELERRYWRNCGLGRPAWYGADMAGSLFTQETKSWNVASLYSALTRLLPSSSQGLPGVNTPYLYFGMWRATFAWHVEDMDLFSINYIHFGAPKYWYAIPQARASALEQTMRGYFPKDVSQCSQFLRHKSFLASPTLLSQSSCRPNTVVQHQGEFVITFPRGYHAGFNLGLNCAESVNFALESWIELGRKAKACGCVNFSVRIDVDQLLRDRAAERLELQTGQPTQLDDPSTAAAENREKSKSPRKRKAEGPESSAPKPKKLKLKVEKPASAVSAGASSSSSSSKPAKTLTKVTLKLGPRPKEPDTFPCCLCVSPSEESLLRVQDPPMWRVDTQPRASGAAWMAHEQCATVVPETWVDEVEVGEPGPDGTRRKERVVFGVDGIVKDRWNLKCAACTKNRHKAHGAPIQCTKGKCPKAFHVSCARDGAASGIIYNVVREVEKEVVLLDPQASATLPTPPKEMGEIPAAGEQPMDVDGTAQPPAQSSDSTPDPAGPRVLKLIRKHEVQVLCPQHNPAIAEAKRTMKQDKIRQQLLALPANERIKLRVSAGVFEVTLVQVLEESKSVEVIWDRGLKREFKWGSVVFGNTEGLTVGQKPSEAAVETNQFGMVAASSQSRLSFPPLNSTPATYEVRPQLGAPAAVTPTLTPAPTATPVPGPSSVQEPQSHTPTPAPTGTTPYYAYQAPGRTATYQYAPGAWTYQYSSQTFRQQYSAPSPTSLPSSPSTILAATTSSPNPMASIPNSSTPAPSSLAPTYALSQYAPYQPTVYPGYSPYGTYRFPTQQQGGASGAKELQWQRPYTGPKSAPGTGYGQQMGPVQATPQTTPYGAYAYAWPHAPLRPPAAGAATAGAYMAPATGATSTPASAAPPPAAAAVPAPESTVNVPASFAASSATVSPTPAA